MDWLKRHILETLLIVFCVILLADHFWPKPQGLVPSSQTMPQGGQPDFMEKLSKDVTEAVKREDLSSPLPMTVYRLQPPLLPKARLLDVVRLADSLWFSSDSGLIEFSVNAGLWRLYDRETGLPGDTAYDIAAEDGRLLLEIRDWKNNGKYDYLTGARRYWFDPRQGDYIKAEKKLVQVQAGGDYTTKNSDLLHDSITDAVQHRGKVWLASRGTLDREKRVFVGGGVSVLDPQSKQGQQYTVQQGLAHDYSVGIAAAEDGSVWVVHWEEERGVSRLANGEDQWQVIKTSHNGIELGGVQIAAAGQYILIGQQRALVIFDSRSGHAVSISEQQGLPGYIVSDIFVDGDDIWVSVYGYAAGGKGSDRGGLVYLSAKDLPGVFM